MEWWNGMELCCCVFMVRIKLGFWGVPLDWQHSAGGLQFAKSSVERRHLQRRLLSGHRDHVRDRQLIRTEGITIHRRVGGQAGTMGCWKIIDEFVEGLWSLVVWWLMGCDLLQWLISLNVNVLTQIVITGLWTYAHGTCSLKETPIWISMSNWTLVRSSKLHHGFTGDQIHIYQKLWLSLYDV